MSFAQNSYFYLNCFRALFFSHTDGQQIAIAITEKTFPMTLISKLLIGLVINKLMHLYLTKLLQTTTNIHSRPVIKPSM